MKSIIIPTSDCLFVCKTPLLAMYPLSPDSNQVSVGPSHCMDIRPVVNQEVSSITPYAQHSNDCGWRYMYQYQWNLHKGHSLSKLKLHY